MKKSDFWVVAVLYGITAWFTSMTMEFPEEAQSYPLFLLTCIFALTTLYLVLQARRYKKTKVIENDVAKSFNGFIARQFCVCILCIVGYMFAMYYLGYYIASVAYIVIGMLVLSVPKKYIGMAAVVLMLLIYGVFTLFLKVPLPVGVLFE
ncbi:MAG: tripartite tricarboxylate transporter TctB family protein [Duodenibacillus sp.]|nr:tripartite tricarboxylate transporter TctB family protein [Duodenibacillus sp.]